MLEPFSKCKDVNSGWNENGGGLGTDMNEGEIGFISTLNHADGNLCHENKK